MTHESSGFKDVIPGMLGPEMIEDTAKIVNEAMNGRLQVNLNNREGGNAPLIAEYKDGGAGL